MHGLRLNKIRLVALVAVAAAVLLAGSLTTPRQAFAEDIVTPQGVLCFELDGLGAIGIGLVRVDDTGGGTVSFTSQVYLETATTLPTCDDNQDPIPEDAVPSPEAGGPRTVLSGTYNQAGDLLEADVCQEDFNFSALTFDFAKIDVSFSLEKPPAESTGTFTLSGPYTGQPCGVTEQDTGWAAFPIDVAGSIFFDGPDVLPAGGADADTSAFDNDWDKDGVRDWDELDPNGTDFKHFDPFFGPGVGGVAELADVASTPLETADSSGMSTALIAAIVAAAAIGATALGGVAMYARRRQ